MLAAGTRFRAHQPSALPTLRRLSPSGWVIGVASSESVEQVARIAKRAPAADTSATVKIVGGMVELTLAGAP